MTSSLESGLAGATEPGRDCPICPRLVAFRETARSQEPLWHNAPVASFGQMGGRLLVVGLAPGLKGANRTGRPFTGDFAGDLLYETLLAHGFAEGRYDRRPDDGLRLRDCLLTNAVRCVPPQNKPTPQEIGACRPFLANILASMPQLSVVVSLGRIAHDSVLRALAIRLAEAPFAHGREFSLKPAVGRPVTLIASYHCSRYNTNTRVLTPKMFQAVFARARAVLTERRE